MASKTQLMALKNDVKDGFFQKKNVAGLGIGHKIKQGQESGEECLMVFVQTKVAPESLTAHDLIPEEIHGMKTDVFEIGEVKALTNRREKHRPAMPGISIGHPNAIPGTLGAIVRDVRTSRRMILSNNHVMANLNNAKPGDVILQPGKLDGGSTGNSTIAKLERFVQVRIEGQGSSGGSFFDKLIAALKRIFGGLFGSNSAEQIIPPPEIGDNRIDAALAAPVSNSSIDDEILEIGRVNGIAPPEINLTVVKSGRTTGLTEGRIVAVNADFQVNYGSGKLAKFEDQILTTAMSEPGDSGALLLTKDSHKAVGLLFAGTNSVSIFSPIQYVIDALQIDFQV